MSRVPRKMSPGFPNRSGTKRVVQPHKMARDISDPGSREIVLPTYMYVTEKMALISRGFQLRIYLCMTKTYFT